MFAFMIADQLRDKPVWQLVGPNDVVVSRRLLGDFRHRMTAIVEEFPLQYQHTISRDASIATMLRMVENSMSVPAAEQAAMVTARQEVRELSCPLCVCVCVFV